LNASISIDALAFLLEKNNTLTKLEFDRENRTEEELPLIAAIDAKLGLNQLYFEQANKLAFLSAFQKWCVPNPLSESNVISFISDMAKLESGVGEKLKQQEETVARLKRSCGH